MAKTFTQWTVLPHRPIEKHTENLWRVEGKMPDGRTQREMIVAKRANGELVIYNAIALEEAEMAEVERFGKPSILIVPSGFHRQDALIYKQRYPDMKVYAPQRAVKRVRQAVHVDGDLDMAPSDDSLRFVHLDGLRASEGVMHVSSADGVSLVFNDAIMNITERKGLLGFVLAPTGHPSVPRLMRWMAVRDKRALAAHLEKLADTPRLVRVFMSHGAPITERPGDALRSAARELVAEKAEIPRAAAAQ